MISFHLIEFIPLINLFQIGICGMFNLVDISRRLKQSSTSLIPYLGIETISCRLLLQMARTDMD